MPLTRVPFDPTPFLRSYKKYWPPAAIPTSIPTRKSKRGTRAEAKPHASLAAHKRSTVPTCPQAPAARCTEEGEKGEAGKEAAGGRRRGRPAPDEEGGVTCEAARPGTRRAISARLVSAPHGAQKVEGRKGHHTRAKEEAPKGDDAQRRGRTDYCASVLTATAKMWLSATVTM